MGEVVQVFLVGRRGKFFAAVNNSRTEHDPAHPRHTLLILGHGADRSVFVAVNLESLAGSQVKKREHVATGQAGDERLPEIDAGLAALVGGFGRGPGLDARIEGPVVVPVLGLVGEVGHLRLPIDGDLVHGHGSGPPGRRYGHPPA